MRNPIETFALWCMRQFGDDFGEVVFVLAWLLVPAAAFTLVFLISS